MFRRRRFLSGVDWQQLRCYTPAGTIVTAEEWAARSVAIYLDGVDMPDHAEDGAPVLDDDFLVLVNGWWEALEFVIPRTPGRPGLGAGTGQFLPPRASSVGPSIPHSFEPTAVGPSAKPGADDSPTVNARSLVVLRGPVTGPQRPIRSKGGLSAQWLHREAFPSAAAARNPARGAARDPS
ncbi:hypothetical protein BJF90_02440 [Pseudonocardia sp. CNS-004]|nr:hypothetical protein BJF90_02440 [Pseudonocardia sp. CNS-004]